MDVTTVHFDSTKVKNAYSKERADFKTQINISNIIYLFFGQDKCYYIGETDASLSQRCYDNTPRHIDANWFNNCDKVILIKLDNELGDIERRAIEATFILSYKSAGHPLANKK